MWSTTQNCASGKADNTLDTIAHVSVMEGLGTLPTAGELSRAIDKFSIGKEPGLDSIPPEAIKCVNGVLLDHMASLLCQCLEEGTILQDMRDCNIVTPYKNKGE